MFKSNAVLFLIGSTLFFSGCAVTNGVVDSVAYTYHTATGIPYPKKSGKIYIESTTTKDTQNVTPLNAQLYGFDAVVAQNIMQCDSLPELTDVLMEHGWEITKNKEEADYHVYTSVLYCGYADKWLRESHRNIPLKDRLMTRDVRAESLKNNLNITEEQILSEDEEALKKVMPKIDVTKLFKNYFNVFEYKHKYKGAPEHIKALAPKEVVIVSSSDTPTSDSVSQDNNGTGKTGNLGYHGINAGASISRSGYDKAGVAIATFGVIAGSFGGASNGNVPAYSGYKTEVKIYNPTTKQTKIEYIDGIIEMSAAGALYTGAYKDYKHQADVLASGLFYK